MGMRDCCHATQVTAHCLDFRRAHSTISAGPSSSLQRGHMSLGVETKTVTFKL